MVFRIAIAAAGPPATATAFVHWHCSDDNVWCYEGEHTLAEAPQTVRPLRDAKLFAPLEVGPDGVSEPSSRGIETLAIDAQTPVSVVAEALRAAARSRPGAPSVAVALVIPDTFAPMPPIDSGVMDDIVKTRAEIAKSDIALGQISARWHRASGSCQEALRLVPAGCAAVADRLIADLSRPECGMDEATVLAMFSVAWLKGMKGPPMVLVPAALPGDELLPDQGTWASVATGFLAHPPRPGEPVVPRVTPVASATTVSTRDGGPAVSTTDPPRVFHPSEIGLEQNVRMPYPRAAIALNLGDHRCRATIRIDASGTPTEVEVEGCPKLFHADVRDGLLRQRVSLPASNESVARSAKSMVFVEFKPEH